LCASIDAEAGVLPPFRKKVPNSFVDLLNGSEVNISSSPLDSFGDGEDIEEGDGENELHGIDEDSFDEEESSELHRN
jgi:hypothetical protein